MQVIIIGIFYFYFNIELTTNFFFTYFHLKNN